MCSMLAEGADSSGGPESLVDKGIPSRRAWVAWRGRWFRQAQPAVVSTGSTGVVVEPELDQATEVGVELVELVGRVRRGDGLPQDPVEVVGGDPLVNPLLEVTEVLGAPLPVALGLEVRVRQLEVGGQLLVVR